MSNIIFRSSYEHTIRHGIMMVGIMFAFCLFIVTLIFLSCSVPVWIFSYVQTKTILLYLILNVSSIVYMVITVILDVILEKYYGKYD